MTCFECGQASPVAVEIVTGSGEWFCPPCHKAYTDAEARLCAGCHGDGCSQCGFTGVT